MERSQQQKESDRLRQLEDEILNQSLTVVHQATAFNEIDEASEEPPASWVKELGNENAWKKFRLCKGAWRAMKDAPIGLKIASDMARSIINSRKVEKAAPAALQITWIAPQQAGHKLLDQYPELLVADQEDE